MRFIRRRPSERFKAALLPLCASLSGLLASSAAYAARPFFTDDARIVDEKACQIESGIQRENDGTEYRALAGCNFIGNLELTLGGARSNHDGRMRTTDVVVQGKTLFKSLETNGWGAGLTVGNSLNPQIHHGAISNLYATVPVSFSFRNDDLIVHANLGWLREKELGQHRMSWGLASELKLGERFWLIGETFGQNRGRPFYHGGFRYALVPGHVEVDAAYGKRFGSSTEEQWFVIGLRLVSPAFLP